MDEPRGIWRLGRWMAERCSGRATLRWAQGEAVLVCARGKVVGLHGLDPAEVSRRLGLAVAPRHDDLLEEARTVAARHHIAESRAAAAAKAALGDALRAWLEDPSRTLALEEHEVAAEGRPSISLPHAMVELLLASEQNLQRLVLPDHEVLLERAPDFLELYAPLRLSEEADLVVAKITGQRTASEIAHRSPHGGTDVLRLLAALVATGLLRPTAPAPAPQPAAQASAPMATTPRRRIPLALLAVVAVVLIAVVVAAALLLGRPAPAAAPEGEGTWGIAVDMGCEPQDLQRILRTAGDNPDELRAVRTDPSSSDTCWRLVWSRFSDEQAAREALGQVPQRFRRSGFEPHPVQLPEEESAPHP